MTNVYLQMLGKPYVHYRQIIHVHVKTSKQGWCNTGVGKFSICWHCGTGQDKQDLQQLHLSLELVDSMKQFNIYPGQPLLKPSLNPHGSCMTSTWDVESPAVSCSSFTVDFFHYPLCQQHVPMYQFGDNCQF